MACCCDIFISCHHGHLNCIKKFIDEGTDINQKCPYEFLYGETPLHIAVKQNNLDCVKFLLFNDATTDEIDMKHRTPLFVAVSEGLVDCVRILLSYGASPNIKDNRQQTPLYMAIVFYKMKIVRLLIEYGADVNEPVNGDTPLHIACRTSRKKCVRYLLEHGADPELRNNSGKKPIEYCSRDSIKALIESYGWIDVKEPVATL